MVSCPMCEASIDVDEDELDEGDALICEECGANLSVSGTSPLELSAGEEDDDFDEEDEDFEDFDEDDEDDDEDDDDDFGDDEDDDED